MSIYRGAGGAGDAVADSASEALLVRELAIEVQADADAAAASATAAAGSASGASTSATNASNSASAAATSATNAAASASTATTQASNAATSATAAQTAETAAELAETNAETAQAAAASSASAASSSASAASTSATNASNSATAAATSATNSANSATASATSATNAANSATAAAGSATTASTQATNAASSATAAASSATAAAGSATSASGSASTATTQAGIATTQAGLAATSASNAATSETNAAASASTATTQAGIATTQAGNAATSATNASNSASAASTSATNAANSATAAAASAASINPASIAITGGSINGTTIGASTPSTGAFTTLGATGVATFSAGTVSAPAITTTGDTNTGIYFPAADTIAFTEGGVESMRIDSSGNVGIGLSNGTAKLTVAGAGANNAGAAATYIGSIQINEAGSFSLQTTGGLEFKGSVFGAGYGSKIFSTDAGDLLFGNRSNSATWSERMRIDSSGNLLVGTTTASYNFAGRGLIEVNGSSDSLIAFKIGGGTTNVVYQYNTTLGFETNVSGSRNCYWSVNGSERMRIDSSGNVGIGTSSPSAKFGVSDGTVQIVTSPFGGGLTGYIGTSTNHALGILTNNTERMRIDSSGNLLVGTTSTIQSAVFTTLGAGTTASFRTSAAAGAGLCIDVSRSSATGDMIYFRTSDTTLAGFITCPTGTTTTYNSVSDYRLKTVVGSVTNSGERIDALEPIEYDWNTGGRTRGFLAHKFAEVYPNSVSGKKDAVDAEGKPKYQAMQAATSEVMADLIAEIQSLRKRVAQLESK